MPEYSRELIFVVEISDRTNGIYDLKLSMKNTLNYMNKLTINEDWKFEITGFFTFYNDRLKSLNLTDYAERKLILNQMLKRLQERNGSSERAVDVFISGMPLCIRPKVTV